MNKTLRYGTSALIALLVVSAVTYGVSAWQSPGTAPTGGNVSGPVTVGSGAQTKNGNFTIGSGYSFSASNICLSGVCRTTWPSAGSGLFLNSSTNQFSVNAPSCFSGQALSWNGSSFSCVSAGGTAYSAGAGLLLSSNQFRVNAPSCTTDQKLIWNGK
jgi:hypothetical protein